MAKRLAELGALQDAVSNSESNPSRLGLAGYIRGLFLDWSANPYNPLTRLSARGRLLGYFWDNGAVGLSMDFANQSFIVKDGTLQSKPFSDIVNFSRTSNATVTNSAGVITYAPHNLLTYSEQFDNAAWTKTNATIIANAVNAPNGYQTADSITRTLTSSSSQARFTSAQSNSTTYTLSVYAKAGTTNNSLALRNLAVDNGFTNGVVKFNLNNGTIDLTYGSTYTGKASIISVGDGWYRCSITGTTIASVVNNLVDIGQASSLAAGGSIGDFLYIWGAQLEVGSTATTYNSTTVKNLLGYSELFDNAAWTKSNSFVQTNLLTYSEAFDNAAWGKSNATVTSNNILAPNGYQTAEYIESIVGAFTQTYFRQNATVANATTYTQSVYAKKGTVNWLQISLGWASFVSANFNLDTGVLGTVSAGVTATITNVGNGWYRCTASAVSTATSGQAQFQVMSANNLSPSAANQGIYAWGAQLVQGATAGDYRRTDAAALPIYYANHNGVVCAEQLNGTAANATILESYTATGSSMTFSVWMRRITGTGNVDITMDTGVTWTTQSITTSWARYSVTSTPASGARTAGIRLVTSGDIIQVFGAQVSDSASLDPYVLNVATAPSAAAYYGARFYYDPVTLAPKGLLIEEQRANLLLNSSLAGTNLATQSVTVTAVAHTLSFYGTGTVTLTGTANTSLVGTGAYPTRSTLTFTPTAGVVLFTVTGTVQYAQLEIGSFATSFIPTAASQVTRTADVASIQGSNFYSWINQNAGSVYSQFVTPASGNRNIIALDDNTANNNIRLRTEGTDPYLKQAWVGTEQVALDLGTVAANTEYKISAAYQINDYAGVIANGTVGTDTVANISIMVMLRLGTDQAGAYLNGTIKSLSYYPTRLNNDTLKGLTA